MLFPLKWFSIYGWNYWVTPATHFFCHYFLCIATVKLLQFLRLIQTNLLFTFYWYAWFQLQQEGTYEICGTQTTKKNIVRYKTTCSAANLYCIQCLKFSTSSQDDLTHHFVRKHSAPKSNVTLKCKLCYQRNPCPYALRQHNNTQHCFLIKTTKIELDSSNNEVDDTNLEEKLRSCQQILLKSPIEWARHKMFKYAETKKSLPLRLVWSPWQNAEYKTSPVWCLDSKLRSCKPLEAEHNEYFNILKNGLTTELAVVKLKISKPPPTGVENYQYLQYIWKQQQMSSFKDFFSWYNKKDVVPTFEAMQKMIAFYHEKVIDMLKLDCTLPNLANVCLHKSIDTKFYPFTEADKDLLEKIRKDAGGFSVIFTRKAVVDETFTRKSANISNSIVGINTSQLYPKSMCIYTRWDLFLETSRFTPRESKTLRFENMVTSNFQRTRPDCNIESFYTTVGQRKIDCFSFDGFSF